MRLRVYLVLLVFVATVPLLAVAVGAALWLADSYRHTAEQNLRNTARALALAVDNHVDAALAGLATLAASPALDHGDLATFYRHARRTGEANGGWVVLLDDDGRQILNTQVPFGSPLPANAIPGATRQVFATGAPVVTDLFDGAVVKRPILGVHVPVERDGRVLFALGMAVEPAELSRLLAEQRLTGDAFAALWDGQGRLIARSRGGERYLGRRVTGHPLSPPGLVRTISTEGEPVVMAIEHVPSTTWWLGVASPRATLDAERQRPMLLLLLGGGGLILAGALLAFLLSRILLRPVNALAASAGAVAQGREAVTTGPFRIAEFERLRQALARANDALREAAQAQALAVANVGLERRVRDRTRELAAAAARLRDSEARFRAYVENSPDVLFAVRATPEGDFLFEDIGPAAERMYGVSAAGFVGKRPEECLPPDEAAAATERWRRCVATGERVRWLQDIELPAGRRRFETILIPSRDDSGRVARLFGSARDVTERHEMEARLHRVERLEALGRLAGGLAHDFNNMLTGITGHVHLMMSKADDAAQVRRHAAAALRGAERSAELIARLMALGRQQAPRSEVQDVNAALRQFEMLARHATGRPVDLAFEIEPAARYCRTDLAQLESAVLNLIVNAADATPSGGRVTVRTRLADRLPADFAGALPGPFLAISVEDTGTGMAPEVAAHAFEPFFTTKGEGRGTGLGLHQVLEFARQGGGTATIDSAVGRGTVATLFLACEAAAPAERASRAG